MSPIEGERYRDDPYKRMVDRHDQDMYRGDGDNRGITTRMAMVENDIEKVREDYSEMSNNLTWIVRLAVGTFLSAIGSMAVALVLAYIKTK